MSGVHGALGWLTLWAAVAVALVALLAWATGQGRPGRILGRVTVGVALVAAAVAATALFLGGLLLLTGLRPADIIHVALGIVALAVLPAALLLATWLDRGGGGRPARYLWTAGGGLLLMLLAVLLILTG